MLLSILYCKRSYLFNLFDLISWLLLDASPFVVISPALTRPFRSITSSIWNGKKTGQHPANVIQHACKLKYFIYGKWSRVTHIHTHTHTASNSYKVIHRDRSVHAILHYLLDNKCCEGIRYLLSNIKFMRMCLYICGEYALTDFQFHRFSVLYWLLFLVFIECVRQITVLQLKINRSMQIESGRTESFFIITTEKKTSTLYIKCSMIYKTITFICGFDHFSRNVHDVWVIWAQWNK